MKKEATIVNPRNLALAQGIFYVLTGIWPILHIESFMAITGPKMDIWLVKTVGVLITVIGSGLLIASVKRQVDLAIIFIATAAAFSLMMADIIYVWKHVISPIYLLDAVAELCLVILWGWEFNRYRKLDR